MTRPSSLTMRRSFKESRSRKNVKGYGFLSYARKYNQQLLDTGLDSLKTASKKVVHKAGESLGNRIADAATKSNKDKTVKKEPVEEITIPPEEREEILQEVLQKWNTIKYLSY